MYLFDCSPIYFLFTLLTHLFMLNTCCREALAKETMSSGSVFESTKAAAPARNAGDATYYNEIDTHADRDARAILEKNVRLNE